MKLAGVTGSSDDPTRFAQRFSPVSNNRQGMISEGEELRLLVSTDVLSEGQNLQDCHIVVNYDLPWAIIRLIQRAGRVDRIGQTAEEILCHSFLPADGVERIINLRGRVRQRLQQNAEVVGADETFFEDEGDVQKIVDLYNEHSGILDDDVDTDVDLASYAYGIWNTATQGSPGLARLVENLSDAAQSSRHHTPLPHMPEGVMAFIRTADGDHSLAYVDREGKSITESQYSILTGAACPPNTPPQPHHEEHHDLVAKAVEHMVSEQRNSGGQLGRPTGARYRTYARLRAYADQVRGQIFDQPELHQAIDDIYQYPLRSEAIDTLNRQLRSGVDDEQLAGIAIGLREDNRLSLKDDETEPSREPQILCSLGLFDAQEEDSR